MAADPLSNVVAIVTCGDSTTLLVNTNTGLSCDLNGSQQSWGDVEVLRVDPCLTGKEYTRVAIHEFTHGYCPRWNEATVDEFSRQLNDLLYLPVVRKQGGLDV
jgi:hypothetical protein